MCTFRNDISRDRGATEEAIFRREEIISRSKSIVARIVRYVNIFPWPSQREYPGFSPATISKCNSLGKYLGSFVISSPRRYNIHVVTGGAEHTAMLNVAHRGNIRKSLALKFREYEFATCCTYHFNRALWHYFNFRLKLHSPLCTGTGEFDTF